MSAVRPAYALLLLGSNIDPEQHIEAAIVQLRACTDLVSLSPVYQTPAVSAPGTADYHNQAVILRDPLSFEELRVQLKLIETALGRTRNTDFNAPRTIDIDILAGADDSLEMILEWPIDAALSTLHHAAIPSSTIASKWRFPSSLVSVSEVSQQLGSVPEGFKKLDGDRAARGK